MIREPLAPTELGSISPPSAKILMVDDQPANLLALEAVLSDLGQQLVKASSGEEALRCLLDDDFAVVLLDVQMQGLDGFATAKLIRGRERTRSTPIIFLTAYETPNFPIAQAYALGAVDYLVKPIVPAILHSKVAVFVDLFQKTQQIRRQEEQLRRAQREQWRVTLASIGDGVIVTDAEGRITFLNAVARDLTGWEPEAAGCFLGDVFQVFDENNRQRLEDPAALVLREHVAGPRYRGFLRARDGKERIVEVSSSPIPGDAGNQVGVVLVFRDVTDRKRLEDELRRQTRELAEANERKDQFLAMMAHELRNPLAPILTNLHIIRLIGNDPGSLEQARATMERQVRHLARLVDDLLDVSRLTRGKVNLHKEQLDLARLMRTAAEDRRPILEQAGLNLQIDIPEKPIGVFGDATRLTQVLNNLLDNAVKFSAGRGTVRLRVAADARLRQAIVAVRDEGQGIEPDVLPRLFQPFVQSDRSLERTRGGLGLGLAVAHGLVQLHGGAIEAASAGPGRGAEFTIRLPLHVEPAALTGMPAERRPEETPLRILVVEDNRDAANSLRMLLELFGHQVTVAYSGPEGVQAAAECHPDVVLCDIGLPGLNGYGVASELRRNPVTAHAQLIAVTGYGQEEDRRRAREAGFDHHLTKPVDPCDLQPLLTRSL